MLEQKIRSQREREREVQSEVKFSMRSFSSKTQLAF